MPYTVSAGTMRRVADRIEAAAKRVVGNAAAMREALVELTDKVLDYLHKGLIQLPLPLESATAKARAALSAPARQCDVGTAEEQEARYKMTGEVYHTLTLKNALAWAQTPYAEEEGAGK